MVRATLLQLLRSPRKQFTTKSYQTGSPSSKVMRWELASNTSYLGAASASVQQQQQRWASGGPSTEKETVVYDSSFLSLIKNIKGAPRYCLIAGILTPIIATSLMPTPLNTKEILVASSMIFVTAGLGLICATDQLVYKIRWRPGSDSFEVAKFSRLGVPTSPKTLYFSDIKEVCRHQDESSLSFSANEKEYVVRTEGFHDKAFLERLASEPAPP